jgi:hypothetical protein
MVAMGLFAVGLGGLIPLTVMNTRQVDALSDRLPADQIHYIVPPDNSWTAKLGGAATVSQDPPWPRTPIVLLVDNGDANYVEQDLGSYNWVQDGHSSAYQGAYRRNNGGNIGVAAIWSFPGLAVCRYEVFVSYPPGAHATNSPFHVYDDAVELGMVRINQSTPPSGPQYEGCGWDSLGTFLPHSGILRVELTDDANGDIAADAVRIVPIKNELDILEVNASPEDGTLAVDVLVTTP